MASPADENDVVVAFEVERGIAPQQAQQAQQDQQPQPPPRRRSSRRRSSQHSHRSNSLSSIPETDLMEETMVGSGKGDGEEPQHNADTERDPALMAMNALSFTKEDSGRSPPPPPPPPPPPLVHMDMEQPVLVGADATPVTTHKKTNKATGSSSSEQQQNGSSSSSSAGAAAAASAQGGLNLNSSAQQQAQTQGQQAVQADFSSSTLTTIASSGEPPGNASRDLSPAIGGGSGFNGSGNGGGGSGGFGASASPQREFSLSRLFSTYGKSHRQQQHNPSTTSNTKRQQQHHHMHHPGHDSMQSMNSDGTASSGAMSRTGHFSVASLPAMRTSIRNSGLLARGTGTSGGGGGADGSNSSLQGSRDDGGSVGGLGGGGIATSPQQMKRRASLSRMFSPTMTRSHSRRHIRKSSGDITMGGEGGGGSGGKRGKSRGVQKHVDLDDFDYVHPRQPDEPVLGGNVGVLPTSRPGDTIKVYVAEKVFYSQVRGKTFRIHSNSNNDEERRERRRREAQRRQKQQMQQQMQQHEAMAAVEECGSGDLQQEQQQQQQQYTDTGSVDSSGDDGSIDDDAPRDQYDLVGKTSHSKDRLVLRDRNGHTIGVIVRRFVHYDKRYDIYGVQPVSVLQQPAANQTTKEGEPLYLRARVIGNLKGKLSIDMFSGKDHFHTDVYRVHKLKTGFLEGKTLYITKQERMAALVKQGAFPKGVQGPAWGGTIAPGIDPCLMVCIIAILDETNRI